MNEQPKDLFSSADDACPRVSDRSCLQEVAAENLELIAGGVKGMGDPYG